MAEKQQHSGMEWIDKSTHIKRLKEKNETISFLQREIKIADEKVRKLEGEILREKTRNTILIIATAIVCVYLTLLNLV